MTGESGARELQRRAADRQRLQLFSASRPSSGRTLQPTDVRSDGTTEPVVVLSHRLWLRLFEGSPMRIGTTLRLNDRAAHDRRRDAAAVRLVWQRRASGCRCRSRARTCRGSRRSCGWRPASRRGPRERQLDALHQRLAQETPAAFPAQGFTTTLHNYLDIDRRERRDADQPAAAARRGGVPAAHRLRQRRQPAAGARHLRARARWRCGCRSAPTAGGCCGSS